MDRMKFPHLENLDRIPWFLTDAEYVTVSEKIDGFNARFGRDIHGDFWVGSRNREVDPETEPLQGFSAFALSRAADVPLGVTIFGEWAGKGIQKRIDYGEPSFHFFDGHFGQAREHPYNWFDPDDMADYAELLDLTRARVIYEGVVPPLGDLDKFRKADGIEGIVIRSHPIITDRFGHPTIAKFKNPAFEERASKRVERPIVDLSNVIAFVEEYATAERLSHVLAQVGETGVDALAPQATGDVLRAMYHDVVREGGADYEALSEADQKALGSVLNRTTKALLDDARLAALAAA